MGQQWKLSAYENPWGCCKAVDQWAEGRGKWEDEEEDEEEEEEETRPISGREIEKVKVLISWSETFRRAKLVSTFYEPPL